MLTFSYGNKTLLPILAWQTLNSMRSLSIRLTANVQCKFLPMTGFEPWKRPLYQQSYNHCPWTLAFYIGFFRRQTRARIHGRTRPNSPGHQREHQLACCHVVLLRSSRPRSNDSRSSLLLETFLWSPTRCLNNSLNTFIPISSFNSLIWVWLIWFCSTNDIFYLKFA